jgi:HNH endonuclease
MSTTHVPAPLRRLVRVRADRNCEYCLAPERLCFQAHQVDHVIAEKHGGETSEDNLALSCIFCNRAKGSDIASIEPVTKSIVRLYNPRRENWISHFSLDGCLITPLTSIGRVTVKLLQMNAPDRVVERQWFIAAGDLMPPNAFFKA